jgi:hypothetical protein
VNGDVVREQNLIVDDDSSGRRSPRLLVERVA